MIKVGIDPKQVEQTRAALGSLERRAPREVATALNATAKKVRIVAARALKKELNCPVKVLKKAIRNKSKANHETLTAVVGLFRGYPIPLKYFKPTQLKRGVTYKTNPKLKGKSVLRDAFIAKQYGGRVYRRRGKARGPLQQVYGPSPGDAFEQAGIEQLATKTAQEELPKEMDRRIRFLLLKAAGTIKGK